MANNNNKKPGLAQRFIEIAKPNEAGFSRAVPMSELIQIDPAFETTNGGGWCRKDGPLGKKFNVKIIKESNKISSIQLDGINDRPTQRGIKESIKKQLGKMPCRILATNNAIEIDHKNGRYNAQKNDVVSQQDINEFQPLSKHANTAKRTHCKECKEKNHRFDATRLGYSAPYLYGDSKTPSCAGCYWHDPLKFNQTISRCYTSETGSKPPNLSNSQDPKAKIDEPLKNNTGEIGDEKPNE